MGDKIIAEIDLEEILGIKIMKEVGVGQMMSRLEVMTGGMTEVSVTVDQGQVLEQIPIEIDLDASSVESMIISQETA